MNTAIFLQLNILYVDHLAVTTQNFDQALSDYLSLPGARLIKGPNINPIQRVQYAFIQLQDGWMIELLAAREGSPIQQHVDRGGGPYHFCYAVADLEGAIAQAKASGAKVVVQPIQDIAFDGRCVAFLVDATHGLFELVEAFPKTIPQPQFSQVSPQQSVSPLSEPFLGSSLRASMPHSSLEALVPVSGMEKRLMDVFESVFAGLSYPNVKQAQMSDLGAWTSLRHLQLIMAVESEFEIDISPHYLSDLTSFSAFFNYLENHPNGFSG